MSHSFDLVTDANGLITYASWDAAAVLQIEERWLLRKPLASFVTTADRPRFRTFLATLDDSGFEELQLQPRKGAVISARVVATRRDGHLVWDVEVTTDMPPPPPPPPPPPTPLVDADHQRLFARLLTRLPHGVVVVDRDLRIAYSNPAAVRALGNGARTGEPLPEPWPDFSYRELAESLFSSSPLVARRVVEASGRFYAVEGLVAANGPTATILIEDVTDRELVRRSERRFVENAAHELRTPLAAITSVVDVLESGAKNDPATLDSFLAHLRAHSRRLTRLTSSLLTLARIQTGQEHVQLDLVELGPVLDDAVARLVPKKGVDVRVEAPERLAVLADRDLLLHALENVIANAVKHTDLGSIDIEARDTGRMAEIEVRDTGRGMTAVDAAAALDRFYRANSVSDGFGLGLAIADEAIRALGGGIALESKPDEGTRVRLTLPSARIVR